MAIVSTALIALFSGGCKKKVEEKRLSAKPESVFTNRMNDVAYVESLRKNREEQGVQAKERHALLVQLKACQERVKATLPAEADEAALKAALARDSEWQRLDAQNAQMEGRIQATLLDARETIRKRMEVEAQAVKAVAAGQAVAVDQVTEPK